MGSVSFYTNNDKIFIDSLGNEYFVFFTDVLTAIPIVSLPTLIQNNKFISNSINTTIEISISNLASIHKIIIADINYNNPIINNTTINQICNILPVLVDYGFDWIDLNWKELNWFTGLFSNHPVIAISVLNSICKLSIESVNSNNIIVNTFVISQTHNLSIESIDRSISIISIPVLIQHNHFSISSINTIIEIDIPIMAIIHNIIILNIEYNKPIISNIIINQICNIAPILIDYSFDWLNLDWNNLNWGTGLFNNYPVIGISILNQICNIAPVLLDYGFNWVDLEWSDINWNTGLFSNNFVISTFELQTNNNMIITYIKTNKITVTIPELKQKQVLVSLNIKTINPVISSITIGYVLVFSIEIIVNAFVISVPVIEQIHSIFTESIITSLKIDIPKLTLGNIDECTALDVLVSSIVNNGTLNEICYLFVDNVETSNEVNQGILKSVHSLTSLNIVTPTIKVSQSICTGVILITSINVLTEEYCVMISSLNQICHIAPILIDYSFYWLNLEWEELNWNTSIFKNKPIISNSNLACIHKLTIDNISFLFSIENFTLMQINNLVSNDVILNTFLISNSQLNQICVLENILIEIDNIEISIINIGQEYNLNINNIFSLIDISDITLLQINILIINDIVTNTFSIDNSQLNQVCHIVPVLIDYNFNWVNLQWYNLNWFTGIFNNRPIVSSTELKVIKQCFLPTEQIVIIPDENRVIVIPDENRIMIVSLS